MKKNMHYLLFLFIFIVYNNLYATKIKILAKINNQIITNIDLEHRLSLAIEISNIPDEIKFRKQIKQQTLNDNSHKSNSSSSDNFKSLKFGTESMSG